MRKLASLLALVSAALLLGAATASAAPVLDVEIERYPAEGIPAGTAGQYKIAVSNTGDAPTSAPVEVEMTLPAGLRATAVTDESVQDNGSPPSQIWGCAIAPDSQSVECTGPDVGGPLAIGPGEEACEDEGLEAAGRPVACRIVITATPDPGVVPGTQFVPSAEACGGGAAACASDSMPTEVLPPVLFDLRLFDGGNFEESGDVQTQAGSHPHTSTTDFRITTIVTPAGQPLTTDLLKDVIAELPPGLVGNPQAIPICPIPTFLDPTAFARGCPEESQVGVITVFGQGSTIPGAEEEEPIPYHAPLYNLKPPKGVAGLLGFQVLDLPFYIDAGVRTGEDYGITAGSKGAPPTIQTSGITVDIWGVPADPSHDALRAGCLDIGGHILASCSRPSDEAADPKAFFSLPTSCIGPIEYGLTVRSWEGGEAHATFLSHDDTGPIGNTGCGALEFSPTLEARPTTNLADAPTGLEVDLHIPQETIDDPNGTVQAHLRDATVTLPAGLTINASGANGQDACSAAQIDLKGPGAANCPDASKLGTVEVLTPLLDHPVDGAVYLAKPYENPFDSLLAIYIAVDDPETGVVVKLAGEVEPDPLTGRLSTTFTDNPQLPFSDFRLRFFAGARAPLKTPSVCGTYTTTSSLTPWSAPESGPPATPSDTWQITQGQGGGCATSESALPHTPGFDAGTVSPIAAHHSPFVLNLRREDGSQRFSTIDLEPPPGLLGKLAGTTRCSEAALAAAAAKPGNEEKASPSCPASSHVGSVVAAAGAGPAPYYAPGEAYLAGPYKGAPLSLAIVTPATAGPFDLGTIVVRTALRVNPVTAQISAVSDPLPRILAGIPLDVRSVQVKLDRPNFILNPTSCDPMAVKGQVLSTLSQVAPLQNRFQLAECTRLGFKPKMTMRLKGGTKRGGHPSLIVTLAPRPGDANIASVSVALPRSEFLDQGHIGTVCTRVQWAADACPAASVYGKVSVQTPLLDVPLTGNVYLRSSDNLLPDLVPDLRGPADLPIRFESAGRTDSVRGGLRNTFDFVPDAPFTKLVVQLMGGNKGLLVNSRDICAKAYRATVKYGAHNGFTYTDNPPLKAKCAKAKRKGKGKARSRAAAR
jgi:hypothetical protein